MYHMRLLFQNAHINQCRNLVKIFKCETRVQFSKWSQIT